MNHLRQVWGALRRTSGIQHHDRSPLDYGGATQRLEVQEVGFQGEHTYTKDAPGTAAFVDYSPSSAGVYIRYVFVDPKRRGQGLARQLLDRLYADTKGDVDWGEVYEDEAWHLFEQYEEKHPDRYHRGKNYT